jgi:hypothetical protein
MLDVKLQSEIQNWSVHALTDLLEAQGARSRATDEETLEQGDADNDPD